MRTPRSVTLIKLLAVSALAGSLVGVESCEEALNPIPPTAEQILQYDNTAKSNVRNAVSIFEACYADTQNYVYCVNNQAVRDLGVIPNGITSPGYSLTATSKSGTSFTAKRDASPPRGMTYTCSAPGKGGCTAAGTW